MLGRNRSIKKGKDNKSRSGKKPSRNEEFFISFADSVIK